MTIFVDAFTRARARADVGYRSVERNPRHCPLFIVFSSFIVAVRSLLRSSRRATLPVSTESRKKSKQQRRRTTMKSSRRISIRSKDPLIPRLVRSPARSRENKKRGDQQDTKVCVHPGVEIAIANEMKNFHRRARHHHPLPSPARSRESAVDRKSRSRARACACARDSAN